MVQYCNDIRVVRDRIAGDGSWRLLYKDVYLYKLNISGVKIMTCIPIYVLESYLRRRDQLTADVESI